MSLAEVPLLLMLVGLVAYAVLGGADFGSAFWQLGVRTTAVREHAHRSMGPVWEANHVWLVFVLVICWTAYPSVFASVFSTLTVPLSLAALGIVLRGTAYAVHAGTAREIERRAVDAVFSLSSIATPFALGTVVGGIASGRVPAAPTPGDQWTSWLNPTSIATGTIAVVAGAYLAAVYLAADAARAGLADVAAAFRLRALAAGLAAGAVSFGGLAIVSADAERLREGLLAWPGILAVVGSAVAGVGTLELVRRRRFEPARYLASVAVAAVVVGWAVAQRPELLPGLTVTQAAAGRSTLIATVVGVAVGAVVLLPSLALLFGLVLRGRFDPGAVGGAARAGGAAPERGRPAPRGRLSLRPALLAAAAGVPLTMVFDRGPLLAAGVVALLASVALAAVALGADAAEGDEW